MNQIIKVFKKYPVIKQHDITDCAAACLASILKFYGGSCSIAKLREFCGTGKEGTTGLGIVKAAEKIGFSAQGFKISTMEELETKHLPLIANVLIDNSLLHYVVIYEVRNGVIKYMDPSKGMVKSSYEDFEKIFHKMVIILTTSPQISLYKYHNKILLKLIYSIIKSLRYKFAAIVFISLLVTGLGIASTYYMKYLFDTVLEKGIYNHLTVITLIFIVVFITQLILGYLRGIMVGKLTVIIDKKLMMDYFRHVLRLPMNFFISRKDGEIISRFMDASKIREAISGMTLTLSIDTLIAIAGGIILYIQNSSLFFITLSIVILYGITVTMFNTPLRNINKSLMESNAVLTSHLVESLAGIETLKAFNVETKTGDIAESKFDNLVEKVLKSNVLYSSLTSVTSGINGLGTLFILWFGIMEVINGHMTAGELLAYNALLQYFLSPIRNLIDLSSSVQMAIAASNRLGEILEIEGEDTISKKRDIKPNTLFDKIEINDITFRYGHSKPVLKNFSLTIKPGEKIAFVGESGSGKTTLARLIMNYYLPESGEIKIGNVDTKIIDLDIIRSKIAFIPQETFLLSGTIKENISLGNPQASLEQVIEASNYAKCHEFIDSFPLKYDTVLEESGANLSGGQRQRLAIARAFLVKPDILIMDEATSNLDSITEEAIGKALTSYSGKITHIIIAHRFSTIRRCDRICVIEQGEIVEQGSHEDLMKIKGKYYSMFNNTSNPIENSEYII